MFTRSRASKILIAVVTMAGAALASDESDTRKLVVMVGKSLSLDSAQAIKRVAVANGSLVEAQAISPKELLISGKAAGETSLTLWQQDGTRVVYNLSVQTPKPDAQKIDQAGEGK